MENKNTTSAPRDAQWREELRKALSAKERASIARVKMSELDPAYRVTCNEEVNQGLTAKAELVEAQDARTALTHSVSQAVRSISIYRDLLKTYSVASSTGPLWC